MITRKEALSARGWWWGRTLPPTHQYLASKPLSKMTDNDIETLLKLRSIYFDKIGRGEPVSWGRYITKKEMWNEFIS